IPRAPAQRAPAASQLNRQRRFEDAQVGHVEVLAPRLEDELRPPVSPALLEQQIGDTLGSALGVAIAEPPGGWRPARMVAARATRGRREGHEQSAVVVDAERVAGRLRRIAELGLGRRRAPAPLPHEQILGVALGVAQHQRRAARRGGATVGRRLLFVIALAVAVAGAPGAPLGLLFAPTAL